MMNQRITFDEISLKGIKTIKCKNCNKRLRRQRKFYQTINPFNKNEKGIPKNSSEINAELAKDIEEWKLKPESCCKK